ncbi:uncharacterized protein VNE69_07064 [Vairimorpha necatrix]|uniref:Uncharacterized protein n=1 Tax=Vairimorpha necatrix TaxID=6039 RepID=A0AAX4JDA8_9MICR
MKNNFEEDERKYFTNGMILNKLGDTREFGNFYELIYNRKLKVLGFLNKDITQFTNPDLRQFESLQHAYDIFISFHIFYPYLYEDYMFMHTLDSLDLEKDVERCLSELSTLEETNEREEHGLACELLLFHEQRKTKGNVEEEEEVVKKKCVTRKNMILRLKTTEDLIDKDKGVRISGYKFIFKTNVE